MRTIRHHILVRINEAERRAMFEKPIVRDDGETVFLVTGIQAAAGTDAAYAQGVQVGEVICVGKEVDNLLVGDRVLLDYIVDHTDGIMLYHSEDEKVVRLDTRTIFYDKDKVIPPNRRTPHPTPVWKKGWLKSPSLVIAVVRNNQLMARWPYVVMEHVERDTEFKVEEGSRFFTMEEEESVVVERVVLSSSDEDYRQGDNVLCETEALFSRTLNGQVFDVVFATDIFAVEEKQLQ